MPIQDFFTIPKPIEDIFPSLGRRCLVIDDAVELVRAANIQAAWGPNDIELKSFGSFCRLEGSLRELGVRWKRDNPQEPSYPKICLNDFRFAYRCANGVSISVSDTDWSEVQPLHQALYADHSHELHSKLYRMLFKDPSVRLPNILTVHCVLQTSDEKIVLTQRGPNVRYNPLKWSASFEEQIEPLDLVEGTGWVQRAALRGLKEEFSSLIEVPDTCCRVLSLLLEHRIMNPALVCHISIPYTSIALTDLQSKWRGPDGEFEFRQIKFIGADLESLVKRVISEDYIPMGELHRSNNWHPTSRYRLLLTMLHNHGLKETIGAIQARE